jgi:hypothetical protein
MPMGLMRLAALSEELPALEELAADMPMGPWGSAAAQRELEEPLGLGARPELEEPAALVEPSEGPWALGEAARRRPELGEPLGLEVLEELPAVAEPLGLVALSGALSGALSEEWRQAALEVSGSEGKPVVERLE